MAQDSFHGTTITIFQHSTEEHYIYDHCLEHSNNTTDPISSFSLPDSYTIVQPVPYFKPEYPSSQENVFDPCDDISIPVYSDWIHLLENIPLDNSSSHQKFSFSSFFSKHPLTETKQNVHKMFYFLFYTKVLIQHRWLNIVCQLSNELQIIQQMTNLV